MRKILIAAILLSSTATPAVSQNDDRRVDRLEREVRALQRRVFPGGSSEFFEPEIQPGQAPSATGSPASAPITDLTDRVNTLEAQLQSLTGQIEQNSFQLRELQSEMAGMRADTAVDGSDSTESAPTIPTDSDITGDTADEVTGIADTEISGTTTAETATSETASSDTANGEEALPDDPAEASYVRGYRLWRDGNYTAAQSQLRQTVEDHPGHRFESFARNLLGRAYLDDGKPANATEIFVRNYQEIPNGDRAADSLYFLGVALTELNYNERACLAFDELQEVYGENLRSTIAEQVPAAREAASCN